MYKRSLYKNKVEKGIIGYVGERLGFYFFLFGGIEIV